MKRDIVNSIMSREYSAVIRNARVLNVFTGEVIFADIGIAGPKIGEITEDGGSLNAPVQIDADGQFAIPGLIDSHVHIESSMVTPRWFGDAVVPKGTTTAVADPHEIANVLGVDGVRLMHDDSDGGLLQVFLQAPSCVPSVPALETAGAAIGPDEVSAILALERSLGLAEVMDFPAVINGDPRMKAILRAALTASGVISGHAPGLRGRELAAYVAGGPQSDHENLSEEEILDKLRSGMWVEARLSSHSQSVSMVARVLGRLPSAPPNVVLCTDDTLPTDLVRRGHMNYVVARCVSQGIRPETAIRMATLNAALRFGFRDRGAISPGKRADICLVPELETCEPTVVLIAGREAARDGSALIEPSEFPDLNAARGTVRLPDGLSPESLVVNVDEATTRVFVNAVHVDEVPLLTKKRTVEIEARNGHVAVSPEKDIASVAVIERHGRDGSIGRGFVSGLHLRYGAVATTVAHDSHNLVVVGYDPSDMLIAAREVERLGGGVVFVRSGNVVARLELSVAGLMSARPVPDVARDLERLQRSLTDAGVGGVDPLMGFLVLSLPVIPELRITNRGLVDVNTQRIIPVVQQ